jgi:hypothetical protein
MGDEECIYIYILSENLEGSDHFGDLGLYKDQWRALVNTVMNLWVPKEVGNILTN